MADGIDAGYTDWHNTYMDARNSTTGDVTLESLSSVMQQCQEIRRQMDRSLAKLCEKGCNLCGRKFIATQSPFGDTVQVCRCTWDAMRRFTTKDRILGPSIGGLRIELFDDGPARF